MRMWKEVVDRVLAGTAVTRDEARAALEVPDADVLELVVQVSRIRTKYFGKKVKLNYLVNIKSGWCPEDCHYCSQSKVSTAPIDKYPFLSEQEIKAAVDRAVASKAKRVCLVASGRGPADHEVEKVASIVEAIKTHHPSMEVCCCLGLLKDDQGSRLKEAGVHAYNHNLNTSERMYGQICETHGYHDREATVDTAKGAGLSPCSGALFGMGETDEDRLDVACSLRDIGVDSIPVNFLIPVAGTPLARTQELTPWKCLKLLCMMKLVNPSAELRVAGGRELHLRSLQPLALFVANSIFIGDYLTTSGQPAPADWEMIRDLGFELVGEEGTPREMPIPDLSDRVEIISHRRSS